MIDREQRAHPRRVVELPVLVHDAGNRVHGGIRFDVRDLSLGGAFLRSDLLFEVGDELSLDFELPDGAERITSRARVVRVARDARDAGMGIAFIDMNDTDRARVRAYLTQP